MGTFLKQRLRSEINAHHTSEGAKLRSVFVMPEEEKKKMTGMEEGIF